MNKAIIRGSERIYGILLKLYPQRFRQEFGEEMAYVFSQALKDAYTEDREQDITSLWARTLVDAGKSLVIQHVENQKDGNTMKTGNMIRLALATGLILLIPLIGMQITDEVNWSLFDFVAAGALLFGAGLAYEIVAGKAKTSVYRYAAVIAVATALMLVWVNLAVGVLGSEDNFANLMYFGVIAVAIVGAVLARFRPRGLAWAMFVTALAQASTILIALIVGVQHYPESSVVEIFAVNGFFMMGWVVAGLLFRWAGESGVKVDAGVTA